MRALAPSAYVGALVSQAFPRGVPLFSSPPPSSPAPQFQCFQHSLSDSDCPYRPTLKLEVPWDLSPAPYKPATPAARDQAAPVLLVKTRPPKVSAVSCASTGQTQEVDETQMLVSPGLSLGPTIAMTDRHCLSQGPGQWAPLLHPRDEIQEHKEHKNGVRRPGLGPSFAREG